MGPVVIGLGGLMLLLEMGLFIEGLSRPNGGSSGLRTLFANWGQSLSRMDTWVNATVQSLLSIPLTSGVIIGLAGICINYGMEWVLKNPVKWSSFTSYRDHPLSTYGSMGEGVRPNSV